MAISLSFLKYHNRDLNFVALDFLPVLYVLRIKFNNYSNSVGPEFVNILTVLYLSEEKPFHN